MYRYPKQILTIEQQIQSYIDAGMEIESYDQVEDALRTIGYYRLRVLNVLSQQVVSNLL